MRYILSALVCGAVGCLLMADPPKITAPQQITGGVSEFVVVKATATNSKWVRYVPVDPGLSVFPSGLLADKTVTVVVAAKPGNYRVLAITGNDEGGDEAFIVLAIGQPGTPPPTDPKPTDPPATKPKRQILIVRPDGAISQEFERLLASPAWDAITASGITVKDVTFTESTKITNLPGGTTLPCVLIREWSQDGKTAKTIGTPKAMPKTDGEITQLGKDATN